MPRPYAAWDPAANAALHVPHALGPLVVDADAGTNVALLDVLLGVPCGQPMLDDAAVGYVETAARVAGVAPATGLRVAQHAVMPAGAAFYGADPANGEPRPLDACDLIGAPWYLQVPYAALGWRVGLRGYVGTLEDSALTADVQVTWADDAGARAAAAARGGYTGALLRALGVEPDALPTMHYAYALAHGKRPTTDSDWAYHVGALRPAGATAGTPTVANGISGGSVRLVLQGGPPTWTALLQVWDGMAWVTAYTTTDDLRTEQTPGREAYLGLVCDLVSGGAAVQGAPPSGAPANVTWFSRLEVAQFEPWVPDLSTWGARDWSQHWEWLTSSATAYALPRMRPVMDLVHVPLGLAGAPAPLRATDPDLGVCVGFARDTWLAAAPPWDMAGTLPNVSFLEHAAVCDEAAYGHQAPFALVGRFRLQGMGTWAVPRALLAAGRPWSTTPATANGMGVYWAPSGTPGEGTLVVRAYDATAAAWVEAAAPFDAADYDDRPVDIALAWSGARGATVGRDDYELRLAVDGHTVARLVNADVRLIRSQQIYVGTDQGVHPVVTWQSFEGLFRAGLAFADALTDADLRAAFDAEAALVNPSFEDPADPDRRGEADGWTWHAVQQVGGWAEWNADRAGLEAWATAQEGFDAGWRYPYARSYADAAARLAATGLTAADVGLTALQEDDGSYWLLTAVAPLTWAEVTITGIEAWAATLAALTVVYAPFAAGSAAVATAEAFALWTFAGVTQPPWLEAYALQAPLDDATGFDGWYDALYGTALYPLLADGFGEAWGTDPFSTAAGPLWVSGACGGGALRGAALTFPLTLPPEAARLLVYADYGAVYALDIPPGRYATAATLAAAVQAAWVAAAGAHTGLAWGAWAQGGATGLAFGWDGSATAILVMLAVLARQPHADARPLLGLAGLAPSGQAGAVRMPAALVDTQPAWAAADDVYLVDPWATVHLRTVDDGGTLLPVEYDWVIGTFDAGAALREAFTLAAWFGGAWVAAYDPGDLTGAFYPAETFLNTNWPDEGYP